MDQAIIAAEGVQKWFRDAATGESLTDHLWMAIGKWAAGFRVGDIIAFDAAYCRDLAS